MTKVFARDQNGVHPSFKDIIPVFRNDFFKIVKVEEISWIFFLNTKQEGKKRLKNKVCYKKTHNIHLPYSMV